MHTNLYPWQQACLDAWMEQGSRGIVSAVTGSGKTLLALGAVKALERALAERGEAIKVRIVVPKTFLVAQWKRAILEELAVPRARIGSYSGAHKDDASLPYMIYVINSARFSLSRHILAELEAGFHVLLIVDECHHCAGEVNAKIFDFVPRLGENRHRYHSLALSATAEKIAGDPRFSQALGGVICRYGFSQALGQGVVSDYRLFRVAVNLLPEEYLEYDELSFALVKSITAVKKLCPSLRRLRGSAFFARLEWLAGERGPAAAAAAKALRLAFRRRELSHLAENRVRCACRLVELLPANSRVLLFGERIACAQRIYAQLATALPGQVALYHSEMGRESTKNALRRYQNGEARILVSCRALDEGLNVPDTEVGVVVSSSRTALQRVQRLGRILRRGAANTPARLYSLHLEEAGEADFELEAEQGEWESHPATRMRYDGDDDRLLCPEADHLAAAVLARAQARGVAPEALAELQKNLERCLVRGDFGLEEEVCMHNRDRADSLAQRNYHTTCLLLARARKEAAERAQ